MPPRKRTLLKALSVLLPAAAAVAGLSSSYMVPVDHDAIQYTKGALNSVMTTNSAIFARCSRN